mgnify:CR=1 FL=1
MPLTDAQQWALVIVPKVTGFISILFSGLVILTVCLDKEKRNKTYHRLLLGISCVDISSSFWLGLSTWPIPRETGIKGSRGNTLSCTVQGFFTQFGVASSFYNASLSVFYLLVIRYGWKEKRIRQVEPFLHAIPILWGLGTSIAGTCLTIFNSANLWCWIASYQDRGANANLYRWVFFYGPLWSMIFIVTINVILIFQHVRRIERITESYTFRPDDRNTAAHQFQTDEYQELQSQQKIMEKEEDKDLSVGDNQQETTMREDIHLGVECESDNPIARLENAKQDTHTGTGNATNGTLAENSPAGVDVKSSTGRATATSISFRSGAKMFRSSNNQAKTKRRSREVAYQSLKYAGSFYFTWTALSVSLS